MEEHQLTDDDLVGLLSNRPESYDRLAQLVKRTSQDPYSRRGPSVDNSELLPTAVVDALEAVKRGQVRTGAELTVAVRRSVWRTVKRLQREMQRSTLAVPFDESNLIAMPDDLNLLSGNAAALAGLGTPDSDEQSGVQLLYEDSKTKEQEARTRIDLVAVDKELIGHLQQHPELMYHLEPRRFEELIATILKDLGYTVELTSKGADGGIDIFATQKDAVGESLLIVDCKRYSAKRLVGVSIVRALFGVGEQLRATMGLVATTSYFSKPAIEFQNTVRNRLSLKDYDDLVAWINAFGRR